MKTEEKEISEEVQGTVGMNLRIQFVDDTTALEIIPRNRACLLNFVTNNIYAFSEDHRMKLNPTKCKEMLINFMSNHNFIVNPCNW